MIGSFDSEKFNFSLQIKDLIFYRDTKFYKIISMGFEKIAIVSAIAELAGDRQCRRQSRERYGLYSKENISL